MDFSQLVNRCLRAARLDPALFNEVEHDRSLTTEAMTVVIIVSVLGGLGAFLGGLFQNGIISAFTGLFVTIVMGLIGYIIWAYLCFYIGTRFMDGQAANVGELLRPLGYASAPRVLSIFSFIPCLGGIIALVGAVWALVAGIVAVREALDFDTGKAVVTVGIGWVVVLVFSIITGLIFGVGMAGMSAIGGLFG